MYLFKRLKIETISFYVFENAVSIANIFKLTIYPKDTFLMGCVNCILWGPKQKLTMYVLIVSWRRLLSYRNQPIELQINGLVSISYGLPSWRAQPGFTTDNNSIERPIRTKLQNLSKWLWCYFSPAQFWWIIMF